MKVKPFGNNPEKIERYRAFWSREGVDRPMVGFTMRGFYPMEEYSVTRRWEESYEVLTPDMINPEEFMEDEERLLREGEIIKDDIIRGDSPAAAVIPFLSGMMGSKMRILPGNVLGEEKHLSWEELEEIELDHHNPWFIKYMQFAEALVSRSAGRFPVSHGAFRGPSDLLGLLRGTTASIIDLYEKPARAEKILHKMGRIFMEVTDEVWKRLPLFHGGYFDGMYQLWAPEPIVRLQEDASALYSPELYRKFLQPVDREIAGSYPCSFIHLHSTSMFLLEAILEVEELKCFEINNDAGGPSLEKMIPYFRMVQDAERSLVIRGSLTADELGCILDRLDNRGLYLLILVKDLEEVEILKEVLGIK